jgi:hypothetical protein
MAYMEITEEWMFIVRPQAEVLLYTAEFRMTLGRIRISGSSGQNMNTSSICEQSVPAYLWQNTVSYLMAATFILYVSNTFRQVQAKGPARRVAARCANLQGMLGRHWNELDIWF